MFWIATMGIGGFFPVIIMGGRSIFTDFYVDLSARNFNKIIGIYPRRVVPGNNNWGNLFDWHRYPSTDLRNRKDNGVVFSMKDITRADKKAYAADCIQYRENVES